PRFPYTTLFRSENRTFLGFLDIPLDRHHAFTPALVEDFIEHPEHIQVEGLVETMAEENDRDLAEHLLDRRQAIGNQEDTQGRTANNDNLEGMPERRQRPAGQHEPTKHAEDNNQITRNFQHMPRNPYPRPSASAHRHPPSYRAISAMACGS